MTPFYLHMMRLNALQDAEPLIPQLAAVSRQASPAEVIELLGLAWREKVMGAWHSLAHAPGQVSDALLDALRSSLGSLDAPPLTVAAVTSAGARALPTLHEYVERDVSNSWGACKFVVAAIEHLGDKSDLCSPTSQDARDLANMLDIAERLRHAE